MCSRLYFASRCYETQFLHKTYLLSLRLGSILAVDHKNCLLISPFFLSLLLADMPFSNVLKLQSFSAVTMPTWKILLINMCFVFIISGRRV